MVPNYLRKAICGWTNYPGMVITHKMMETEMGYRGSKSVLLSSTVKEQRVDGSWSNSLSHSLLRCTLMGFERNYQIKVLSKQLNKTNFHISAYAQVQKH